MGRSLEGPIRSSLFDLGILLQDTTSGATDWKLLGEIADRRLEHKGITNEGELMRFIEPLSEYKILLTT